MSRFTYSLGGVALVVAIVIGITSFNGGSLYTGTQVAIEGVGERAFGDLSGLGVAQAPSGRGGGGNTLGAPAAMSSTETDAAVSRPQSGGGGAGIDQKMIAPWPAVQYKYVYKGEPVEITEDTVNVLKRLTGDAIANQMRSLVSRLNFDGINIKSFQNLYIQQLMVAEQKEFGHAINFNAYDGTISIYENWEKWASLYPACDSNGACPTVRELTQADVLPNDRAIALADAFIAEHDIDMSSYGPGEVIIQNYGPMPLVDGTSQLYVPDVMNVVYPLLVDGKKVYDGGQMTGMYVAINLRAQRVSSLNSITVNRYESSAYATEKDFNKILSVALKGGQWGWMPEYSADVRTVEIQLGTPTLAYTRTWKYEANKQIELIVPALVFPVQNPPTDGYFYQQQIAVPIVQELLSQPDSGPIIMPMVKEAL